MAAKKKMLHLWASVLIVLGLVLLVWGLPERRAAWIAGLVALGVALVLSLATRWIGD